MDLEKAVKRIGELIGDVVEQFKTVKVERQGLVKRMWTWAVATYELVKGCVLAMEQVANEFGGLSGADKRTAVIEYLNRAINIPVLPEFVEGWVFGYLVDTAVKYYNKLSGKKWAQDLLNGAASAVEFARDVLAEPEPEEA